MKKLTTWVLVVTCSALRKFHRSGPPANNGKAWKVKWNPSLIFAGMEKGDKVSVQAFLPQRGAILDRNGNPLALDKDVYEMGIIRGKLGESKEA